MSRGRKRRCTDSGAIAPSPPCQGVTEPHPPKKQSISPEFRTEILENEPSLPDIPL